MKKVTVRWFTALTVLAIVAAVLCGVSWNMLCPLWRVLRPAARQDVTGIPEIRKFDIGTIERLGREIYEQDAYAAKGTDIMLAQGHTLNEMKTERVRGWIVFTNEHEVVVRFIREPQPNCFEAAYDVVFRSPRLGKLEEPRPRNLPADQLAQFKARQIVLKNIPAFFSDRYNTVVLPDVGGDGFLVYALAATLKPNLFFVGGHYRFTVSANGDRIERTDRLFKSCLKLDRTQRDIPKDFNYFVTDVVSDTPLETHVYISLLLGRPFLVITSRNRQVWEVQDGKIHKKYDGSNSTKGRNDR